MSNPLYANVEQISKFFIVELHYLYLLNLCIKDNALKICKKSRHNKELMLIER